MRTVIDANLTTLIAAAVLFHYGTGPVRGFAVTLAVSILASMVTAVFFSQYLLRLVVDSGLVRRASVLFGEKEVGPSAAR
jgi:preprotein translocase subunit SecD